MESPTNSHEILIRSLSRPPTPAVIARYKANSSFEVEAANSVVEADRAKNGFVKPLRCTSKGGFRVVPVA